jgi:hypothetical protein
LLDFIDTLEKAAGKKAIRNYLDMQKGDAPRPFALRQIFWSGSPAIARRPRWRR